MRSVGYSELFSLSREDVLSAMKDYPDARVSSVSVLGKYSFPLDIIPYTPVQNEREKKHDMVLPLAST